MEWRIIGQIEFNNLKSFDDFELKTKSIEVSYPTPKLIKESVPFQNGEYDFTELYGETTYENRSVKVTFEYDGFKAATRTRLNSFYTKVINWLYNSGESELIIDYEVGVFKGRVVDISSIEVLSSSGEITVEFDCYPFRIYKQAEGNILWDDFNFELDYLQQTKFNVSGSKSINIINSGSKGIVPTVICSSEFDVIKGNTTYKFNLGSTKDWRFILDKGVNNLTLNGTGNIEFVFRKEVL